MKSKEKHSINIPGKLQSGITNIGSGDQTLGDQVSVTMGDQVVMSGNFTNANVNVKAHLENVAQNIGAIATDQGTKDTLKNLVDQLEGLLQKVPPEQIDNKEAIAKRLDALIGEAKSPKPDKEMLQITGDSLKKAAANLQAVMPAVLGIATQIVTHVLTLNR